MRKCSGFSVSSHFKFCSSLVPKHCFILSFLFAPFRVVKEPKKMGKNSLVRGNTLLHYTVD